MDGFSEGEWDVYEAGQIPNAPLYGTGKKGERMGEVTTSSPPETTDDREAMLHDIKHQVAFTRDEIGKDALDECVLAAIAKVPTRTLHSGTASLLFIRRRPGTDWPWSDHLPALHRCIDDRPAQSKVAKHRP